MEPSSKKSARLLTHLKFDMSLYDCMVGQLEIVLHSGNPNIDHGFFKGGLRRGQKLELLFANGETNCDIQLSFAVRAILPRRWQGVELSLDGQEGFVIYYNNNKSVSMLRLRENIEYLYVSKVLPLMSFPQEVQQVMDQQEFIETCLKRLIIISPNNPWEFAFAVRNLPSMLKEYRPVGLVIVDSINTFIPCDYEIHKDDENRRSTITVDPKATSFQIKAKGIATKKRRTRTFDQTLFGISGDYVIEYWKSHKFPLIITKLDNTSLSSLDNKLVGETDPVIELHLKKLESDQMLIIANKKTELCTRLCEIAKLGYTKGIMIITKADESTEYNMLAILPRENTLYAELDTLDKKIIKLAN